MAKLKLSLNLAPYMKGHSHGTSRKDVLVVHETVSSDAPGLADEKGIASYLASKDYGIHGITDFEGNTAWALGLGESVFWHCGGVNERSCGIEQISRVMLQAPTNVARRKLWAARQKELHATAKLIAAWHNADPARRPLRYSDGRSPGVTSHWDVSQWSPSSQGHTDCWPVHKGGYYPILEVIQLARVYAKAGLRF